MDRPIGLSARDGGPSSTAVELNHTIVHAHDKHATARHLTSLLGLPEHTTFGPFAVVELGNGVSLDVAGGHTFWADPLHGREGVINHDDGGRGLYWTDPNGHNLEILTVPYGGWPS